jgi:hypothetical protein
MRPLNWLEERSSHCRLERLPREYGRWPTSRFRDKSRVSRLESPPIGCVPIDPLIVLPDRSTRRRDVIFQNERGRLPESPLDPRETSVTLKEESHEMPNISDVQQRVERYSHPDWFLHCTPFVSSKRSERERQSGLSAASEGDEEGSRE